MTRAEKAERIQKVLDEYFPRVPIPLDHREGDAYELLIAVLLSAQCTDVRVNEVTPRLFALASGPEEMRKLGVRRIRAIIPSLSVSSSELCDPFV